MVETQMLNKTTSPLFVLPRTALEA